MQMIDIECDTRQDAGAVQPVKIMAGNKCDLKEARVVSSRQGLEYARSKGCGFMETSAREMVNIEETFARESHYCISMDAQAVLSRDRCASQYRLSFTIADNCHSHRSSCCRRPSGSYQRSLGDPTERKRTL